MKRLILIFILLAAPAWGAEYYMRADGTAGSKAAATGCGAASTAIDEDYFNYGDLAPGDILNLCDNGGNFSILIPPVASLTIQEASGHSPTISEATENFAILISGKNNTTVKNITTICTKKDLDYNAAIRIINSNDVLIENVEVKNSANGVWITGTSDGTIVQNSYIHDNTYELGTNFNNAGIEIANASLNTLIQNNRIENNGNTSLNAGGVNIGAGIRIDPLDTNSGTGLQIIGNRFVNNGDITTWEDGQAIDGIYADGVIIRGNYFEGSSSCELKNGMNNLVFESNVAKCRSSAVFMYGEDAGNASTGGKIRHNTFILTRATGDSPDYGVLVNISNPNATSELFNNILVHTGTMAASKIVGFQLENMDGGATDIATFDNKFDYNTVYNADKWIEVEDDGSFTDYTLAEYKAAFANQNQNSLALNPQLNSSYQIGNASVRDTGAVLYAYADHPGDYYGNKCHGSGCDPGAVEWITKKPAPIGEMVWFKKAVKCASTDSNCYTQAAASYGVLWDSGGDAILWDSGGDRVSWQ